MYLRDIAATISSLPHIGNISVDEFTRFIRLAKLTRKHIEIAQHDKSQPPVQLPDGVQHFLGASLQRSVTEVCWLWYAFKTAVWTERTVEATTEDITTFHAHGLARSIGYRDIFPSTRTCTDPNCKNYRKSNDVMTLSEPNTYPATLFTLRDGALPVYTTSLYCHSCHRRYHHNYYVDKARSARTYYGGAPPAIIQVSTHYFVESAVVELFGNSMVFGWLSAHNCARIINNSLAIADAPVHNNPHAYGIPPPTPLHQSGWHYSLEMSAEVAMNAFLTYSLLLDKAEHSGHLELPHDCPSQKDRLSLPLLERNKAMEGIGQEEWDHACDLCFIVQEGEDGQPRKVQYAVGDGLSIGRPCCAVHDCKVNLATKRDVYCPFHAPLAQKCAVLDCDKPRSSPSQTCSLPAHQALEQAYRKDGSRAIHQLRSHLHASGVSIPADPVALSQELDPGRDDEVIVMSDGGPDAMVEAVSAPLPSGETTPLSDALDQCSGKPSGAKSCLKARFGRRRTHNEQLVERPCGIILSRATFFGSEAISAVKDHLKAVFPTAASVPEIFIYDNNCKLRQHLNASGDQYFKNTGLPVDVFHFKTKHRITDTECQQFCNPAAFPDLVSGDTWRVNTSICEETNAWMGGYMAGVREMEATRYAFFLDEMIKRRNRFTIAQLERRGHCPWKIPISILFPANLRT